MSDWKRGAAERRDERHTKAPEQPRPLAAKKDKRRWCRGKTGVEHKPVCMREVDLQPNLQRVPATWVTLTCSVCGKKLAHYWPSSWDTRPPPDWAREVVRRTGGERG